MTFILAAWRWFSGVLTVIVIACLLAYGVLAAFSPASGPVVEVIAGPGPDLVTVPYGGALKYEITTRRLESCPGVVTRSWVRRSSGENRGARYESSAPITSAAIRLEPSSSVVTIQIPGVVTPGVWTYTSSVSSSCPRRHQSDVLARFEVHVTDTEVHPE